MFFFEKKNQKTFASESGFALLLVLWSMALLALLGAQVTGAGRSETRLASALRSGAQLRAAADGAVYETIWHLMPGGGESWEPGTATRVLEEPGGRIVITVTDERGKLDINQVPPGLLQGLFGVLGADRETATHLATAVTNWRAPQPSGNGPDSPEVATYRASGLAYGPNGAEFQRLDELQMVQGMTPALYHASLPYLTMALEQGPWLSLASPVVLAAAAKAKRDNSITMENADARGPIVLRISAQATGQSGAAFTRRVLFRLDGTLSGPAWKYRILSWEDGPDTPG